MDLCRESERLEAVKLADYKQLRGKLFEERYLDYSDYDVGPPLLSHILSSVGLKGHNPKYRLTAIIKWCKDFIRPVLNGSPSILHIKPQGNKSDVSRTIFQRCGMRPSMMAFLKEHVKAVYTPCPAAL